jgi:hypothetical protein
MSSAAPAPVRSAIRGGASSCRTVPTRHGTHWPQDSSRKSPAMRSSSRGSGTVPSKAGTTPDPRVVPASRVPSKVSGTSSSSGRTKPPAAPPSSTARSPSRTPARPSSSPSVAPNGSS